MRNDGKPAEFGVYNGWVICLFLIMGNMGLISIVYKRMHNVFTLNRNCFAIKKILLEPL